MAVGSLSGFFGIGGGFLVVPGLIAATGMPMIQAVGTSLFSVGVFCMTTAGNYAAGNLIDWEIAVAFIAGGMAGGLGGVSVATRLSTARGTLSQMFAAIVFLVGCYVFARNVGGLF